MKGPQGAGKGRALGTDLLGQELFGVFVELDVQLVGRTKHVQGLGVQRGTLGTSTGDIVPHIVDVLPTKGVFQKEQGRELLVNIKMFLMY